MSGLIKRISEVLFFISFVSYIDEIFVGILFFLFLFSFKNKLLVIFDLFDEIFFFDFLILRFLIFFEGFITSFVFNLFIFSSLSSF